ncbi:MAG: YncE family protein [Acidobacteria bacterium]|nr:YncE family protein [Acidobacteriota bacterium]
MNQSKSFTAVILLLLLFPAASARQTAETQTPGTQAVPASYSERFEHEGIVLDFEVRALPSAAGAAARLMAGTDAVATFRLTYAKTGEPVSGLRPNAWIDARRDLTVSGEGACTDKIRTFMGGLLSARADIDLNSYLLLTLNHDRTITFINPQISFSVTKLEGIVELPGVGADWALAKDKETLYVSMPDQSAVAVVDTVTKKLTATLPTGEKTRPMRVALQPDGQYVWVGLDGSPFVVVIDAAKRGVVGRVNVGEGLHTFAFSSDSKYAFVTNSTSDTVSVVDVAALSKKADVAVGKTPVAVAYSEASRLAYAAALNGETVSAIDPRAGRVVATTPTRRGVVALRFAPGGRFALAANQLESTVGVLDASTNTFVGSAEVVKSPDQIVFTDRYAYVRGQESEKFSLIELGTAEKGKVSPVHITAGERPPSRLPGEIGVADMIAPTPDGNSVMLANAPDQTIYYYTEGMMAPLGTLSNYKRRALALLLLDRSLSEVSPGVYTSPVKLNKAGAFDVPVLVDRPRFTHCFRLSVAESPEAAKSPAASLSVEALFSGRRFRAGEAAALRFKLTDANTKRPLGGLKDVQVLVFEAGVWQQRYWAAEAAPGEYEVKMEFPHSGIFRVLLRSASRGVTFADLPYTNVPVDGGEGVGSARVK